MIVLIYFGLTETVATIREGVMSISLLPLEDLCYINLILYISIFYINYATKKKY